MSPWARPVENSAGITVALTRARPGDRPSVSLVIRRHVYLVLCEYIWL